MKLFIKTNSQNVITDAIEYQHEGYIEIDLPDISPSIRGGWFKYEGGQVVEYPELKPPTTPIAEIEQLKSEKVILENRVVTLETENAELTLANIELWETILAP